MFILQNFSILSNSHQSASTNMWATRKSNVEITISNSMISQKSYCQNTVKSLIPHQILTFLEAIM